MAQHITFVERLRSALGHDDAHLVGATRPASGAVAEAAAPVEDRGPQFAERLRAALPAR